MSQFKKTYAIWRVEKQQDVFEDIFNEVIFSVELPPIGRVIMHDTGNHRVINVVEAFNQFVSPKDTVLTYSLEEAIYKSYVYLEKL